MNGIPAPGIFVTLYDANSAQMLQKAYVAINSIPGGWNAMSEYPNFTEQFSNPEPGSVLQGIIQKINEDSTHSGGSFSWTMRVMQRIAIEGWVNFAQAIVDSKVQKPNAPPPPLERYPQYLRETRMM